MITEIFVVLLNGKPYYKDSAIRTYKTRERAEKETQRFVRLGYKVEIGELTLTNISDISKGSD